MTVIAFPARATYFVARNVDGNIAHIGVTSPVNVTTTGQPIFEATEDETEHLAHCVPVMDTLPELPGEGESLTAGDIYRYGDTVLMVRQDHTRMHFEPSETPALFLTVNSTLDWVVGEQVQIGNRRLHEGVWYEAVQAHVTQADWTPPSVPALWAVVPEEPGEVIQPWSQGGGTGTAGSYNLGDQVTHDNPNDGGAIWVYESAINANTTEPGRDGTFDRWWTPLEPVA
jgi:hypothetical protein